LRISPTNSFLKKSFLSLQKSAKKILKVSLNVLKLNLGPRKYFQIFTLILFFENLYSQLNKPFEKNFPLKFLFSNL